MTEQQAADLITLLTTISGQLDILTPYLVSGCESVGWLLGAYICRLMMLGKNQRSLA